MAKQPQVVTGKTIAQRISRNNKSLTFELWDVVEWCAECEIEAIGEPEQMTYVENEEHTIKNKRILLPCNLYRLLNITQGGCTLKYTTDGTYANFYENHGKVQMNYYAIPMDEDGFPLVRKGHEEACYWYCMQKLYFEDFMNGSIDANRFAYIERKLNEEVANAQGSFRNYTRDDMNDLYRIIFRMKRYIQMPKSIDWGY